MTEPAPDVLKDLRIAIQEADQNDGNIRLSNADTLALCGRAADCIETTERARKAADQQNFRLRNLVDGQAEDLAQLRQEKSSRGAWSVIATILTDAAGVFGCALLSYSAWCIYPPAGTSVAGGFLLAAAILVSRAKVQ